jgi:hypothetical protein
VDAAPPALAAKPLERAAVAGATAGYRSRAGQLTLATTQPAAESQAEEKSPRFVAAAHPDSSSISFAAQPLQRVDRPLPPLPMRNPPPPPVPSATMTLPTNIADDTDAVEESPPPDLDALARDVLPRIKRLLAIERERRPMW